MININKEITRLVNYGIYKKLIKDEDRIFATNLILAVMKLNDYEEINVEQIDESAVPILDNILEWAAENSVLESNSSVYRDLLDTKLMACLMPRPSEVISEFNKLYKKDPEAATKYYYNLSIDSNYIRMDRIEKNEVWKTETKYGDLDITINLSKPEKDPKAIAAAKNMPSSSYPKCLLCKENEGYEGRINHPARGNHRIIPIELNNQKWFLQYSPYVYYNEHCIVFKAEHDPMKISKETFTRLLDFVDLFPHYFIGSNADLPIVGGSILSHDHFQGGNYEFAMAKAPVEECFEIDGYEGIKIGIVRWPMSVIRITGKNKEKLVELAEYIFASWKNYSDKEVGIIASTEDISHNTVTPIARKRDNLFELDLVLRNNITSEQFPDGIYHPHQELHHIKKENIGLIEVMGLAVLPARLKNELNQLTYYLLNQDKENELKQNAELRKHLDWYYELKQKYEFTSLEQTKEILNVEVGLKFLTVLEHAGIFKRDKQGKLAFRKFIQAL